jgi:hypothetical protein
MDVDVAPPSGLLQRLSTEHVAEEGEVVDGVSLMGRLGLGLQERLGDTLASGPRPRRRIKKRGKKKKAN